MRIVVIGASGRTGARCVEIAAERGHEVVAVVRASSPSCRTEPVLSSVGDPLDRDYLRALLLADDIVISTLGQQGTGSPHLLADAAKAVIAAAAGRPIRYITVSQGLLFEPPSVAVRILRLFLRRQVADSRAMESHVQASALAWTIVRPPRLTTARPKGGYQMRIGRRPPGLSMTRADLGCYLVDEATVRPHAKTLVGVS